MVRAPEGEIYKSFWCCYCLIISLPLRDVSAPVAQGIKAWALQILVEKPPFSPGPAKPLGFPSSSARERRAGGGTDQRGNGGAIASPTTPTRFARIHLPDPLVRQKKVSPIHLRGCLQQSQDLLFQWGCIRGIPPRSWFCSFQFADTGKASEKTGGYLCKDFYQWGGPSSKLWFYQVLASLLRAVLAWGDSISKSSHHRKGSPALKSLTSNGPNLLFAFHFWLHEACSLAPSKHFAIFLKQQGTVFADTAQLRDVYMWIQLRKSPALEAGVDEWIRGRTKQQCIWSMPVKLQQAKVNVKLSNLLPVFVLGSWFAS